MENLTSTKLIFILLLISVFHTGLIWVIQLVHYPGFLHITGPSYPAYQQFHMKAISYIVAPSMGAELILSLALFAFPQTHSTAYWLSFALLMLIWGVTFFGAVPMHGSLVSGYDATKIRQLVSLNWIRTATWTLRSIVLGAIVWKSL